MPDSKCTPRMPLKTAATISGKPMEKAIVITSRFSPQRRGINRQTRNIVISMPVYSNNARMQINSSIVSHVIDGKDLLRSLSIFLPFLANIICSNGNESAIAPMVKSKMRGNIVGGTFCENSAETSSKFVVS